MLLNTKNASKIYYSHRLLDDHDGRAGRNLAAGELTGKSCERQTKK